MGSLDEEEVKKDFPTDVEDEAELDSNPAAIFGGEVP